MNNLDIPENPNPWLRFLLMVRSWPRGRRQSLLVGSAFSLFSLWMLYVSLLLARRFWGITGFGLSQPILAELVFWLTIPGLSLLLLFAGLYHLFQIAHHFVVQLYALDEESQAEVRERIRHRFWGWNGLSLSNFMLIKDTKLERPMHWSTWLGGPTSLIIMDGFAVYLERGNRFARVEASGFPIAFLDARETIKAIVDLRPQIREANVNAWTNDGIKVTLKLRVEFQIEPPAPSARERARLVYPCNREAVRRAVEYTAVRSRDGKLEESDWRDGTMGRINGLLAHHISSYHFDELFITNEGNGQILSEQAIHDLLEKANRHLKRAAGVHVMSIQIIDISIPEEIRKLRLNVWGAKKDSLVSRIQGESQAYLIRTNEEARARAQRELIVAIAKSLGQVDATHFPDEPLLMSLSGILDQGLRDPLVQSYMARGTLDALKKLKDLL